MRSAPVLLFVLCLAFFTRSQAQTTTNCLDVESILVNACGNPEGYNEMVRVLAGPNPLTVANISGSWPNFAFDPWIMNATTANKTAALNATITTCGFLREPLNGIIPANKKFIIVPSYMIDVTQNSFNGLTDTLYIIYQNSSNGTGRFGNSGSGTRTLTVSYTGCTNEVVSYQLDNMLNIDGERVNYTISGTPSYDATTGCLAPVVPFTVDAGPAPAPVCPGGTVTLNGSVNGPVVYQHWSGGTGTFSAPGSLSTNYTLAAGQTSPFWLYLKIKGACADTLKDSVLVTIQQQNPINITANGPLAICSGNSLTLTATGGGSAYQWVGGPATATYTISTPGVYTVQSSDACYNYQQSVTVTAGNAPTVNINQNDTSICPGTNIVVTATGNGTIGWLPGPVPGNTITISAPGTYIAGISNGCGIASDTLVVTASAGPSVQITTPEPVAICAGQQVTLTATGNGPLTWSPSGTGTSIAVTTPGTYTVSTTNACGTATDQITVTAGTAPTVNIDNPMPVGMCAGDQLTLTATGTGNGTITWSNGPTGPSNTITAPGDYIVTISNACGTASDAITVGLNQAPYAQILNGTPITICPGTDVTLQGLGNGTLTWSNGGSGTSTVVNQGGTYTLISQTVCGTDTAYITIDAFPIDANFTATPVTGFAPLDVTTDNQSAGATGYSWTFGDGNTSTEDSPAHTYTAPGTYNLVLYATNAQGCQDSMSIQIVVTEQILVELPNVFTPNGDQSNDEYYIKATGVTSMKAEIYNRWGQKMFTWTDPSAAWNGKTTLGAPATPGVYVCVVEAVDAMGEKHIYKTTVTLLTN